MEGKARCFRQIDGVIIPTSQTGSTQAPGGSCFHFKCLIDPSLTLSSVYKAAYGRIIGVEILICTANNMKQRSKAGMPPLCPLPDGDTPSDLLLLKLLCVIHSAYPFARNFETSSCCRKHLDVKTYFVMSGSQCAICGTLSNVVWTTTNAFIACWSNMI